MEQSEPALPDFKNRVLSGLVWKILENGGVQLVQLLISLVLARLLGPEGYGTISLLLVFIAIANVFIQSGFQTALIQKREVDELDFTSVFYLSLFLSAVLYVIIFVCAPSVGSFYEDESLVPMLRVLALMLFFGSVVSVQIAMVSRQMAFKKMCLASLGATCFSGIVGVAAALIGLGTWALVWQQLLNQLLLMVFLWLSVGWKPGNKWSFNRIKSLFSYGWKLLCSSLIDTIYNNGYTLVIGKLYSKDVVGYYNRGNQFPQLIVNNLAASIQAVLLPAFSARQEDTAQVKAMVRRSIVTGAFVLFPMMAGLIAVAKPLIYLILTEQWMPCVPYLRMMCLAYAVWPIHIANLQAINAMGRSDIFLKLEIIKKILGVFALIAGIPFGIYGMLLLKVAADYIGTLINAWPNKRLLDYSFFEQWKDVMPSACLSAVMGAAVWMLQPLIANQLALLLVQILVGAVIYLGLSHLLHLECYQYLKGTIIGFLKKT